MSERFIKLIPSEEASWLMEKYPFAYLLLILVAKRARRTPNDPNGLGIGEAHIGDHKSIGATRQQYRTALKVLIDKQILQLLENCRNRKKSTTGTTTVGSRVKLLNSSLFDINVEESNHRSNHRPTTDQPPTNHEQECKERKECKETTTTQSPSFEKPVCVVFSCLEKIQDPSITENLKIELSAKYPEERVCQAVLAILAPGFLPKTTLAASLRAACRDSWSAPQKSTHALKENRKLAERLEGVRNKYQYVALNAGLEIVIGQYSKIIIYEMSHEAFCSEIEKVGKISLKEELCL